MGVRMQIFESTAWPPVMADLGVPGLLQERSVTSIQLFAAHGGDGGEPHRVLLLVHYNYYEEETDAASPHWSHSGPRVLRQRLQLQAQ